MLVVVLRGGSTNVDALDYDRADCGWAGRPAEPTKTGRPTRVVIRCMELKDPKNDKTRCGHDRSKLTPFFVLDHVRPALRCAEVSSQFFSRSSCFRWQPDL